MKFLAAVALIPFVVAYTEVNPNKLPYHSEKGQFGYNNCGGKKDSKSSKCQTAWLTSATDFCLWAPPKRDTIGNTERYTVAYCTKAGHGTRLIPKGTFTGVHFVQTPDYLQVTGQGDFTKINIPKGDDGGELDPHGADGLGNPIGGVVLTEINGKRQQFKEWTSFISDREFCFRGCFDGANAKRNCQHIYDTEGCWWNMPANYGKGFETCKGDSVKFPMGEYPDGKGGTSTFYHGQSKTPGPNPAPKSSSCKKVKRPDGAKY